MAGAGCAYIATGGSLGHFQFGGATHCLVFGPGVIADFTFQAVPSRTTSTPPLVQVRSRLPTAVS